MGRNESLVQVSRAHPFSAGWLSESPFEAVEQHPQAEPEAVVHGRIHDLARLERQANEATINRPAKKQVDKVELAKLLWPVLEGRLDATIMRRVEPNIPIAKLVIDAYRFALTASLYRYFSVPLRRTRG